MSERLPWRANGAHFILDSEGRNVCRMWNYPNQPKRYVNRVELIVRAVNCHDELVGALEECLRAMENLAQRQQAHDGCDGWSEAQDDAEEKAQAALKKARGGYE